MKLLTYILTLIVIFLSVKPAIDAIPSSSEASQTCCSNSKCSPISENQNSNNQNEQEDNRMCNPFQACGCCLLLCVSTPFFPTLQGNFSMKESFGYQSFIPSQFISDFWQPPKFV
jgi:hypothetical protein